jgi:hypothetical protein
MATYMTSAQFKQIVSPILNEPFDGVYDVYEGDWKGFMTEKSGTKRRQHEEPVIYGMQAAPEMPEGEPILYDSGGISYNAVYLYRTYGLGFAITKQMIDDGEHINIGRIQSKHLANSLTQTRELNAANLLNFGFGTNPLFAAPDGVPLLAANHPIQGGTYSNILGTAAALSQTSLEQLLTNIGRAKDDRGFPANINSENLVVSPENEYQANTIVNSALRAGGNFNDVNSIKLLNKIKAVKVVRRLTSPVAWYVTTDVDNGLQFIRRNALERGMEGDFDTNSMKYKASERYAMGYTNPRGIFGTAAV